MTAAHEALNPIHPSVLPHLDPVFVKLYNENVANTPNKPIDLAILRSKYSVLYSYGTGPAPEPARIYDTTVPGYNGDLIPVRVYEPSSPGPWPVHIDFHGGGWGLGDLDTEAHICKHLSVKADVCVIDIGYRLVPEQPFPIGIQDSFAALQYIHSQGGSKFNIDPTRISLGGVSAGGNIALIVAHLARDASIPLNLVAVGTPVIDDISKYASASESPYPSVQQMEHAPTLNWARLKWFDNLKWESLSSDVSLRKEQLNKIGWYANAMNAPDFTNLPKTVIYTAGCDPLRDEGEAYAMKLVEGGNEVTLKRFEGVPHPFMHMDKDLWQAKEFIDKTAAHIRVALH
ncbi:Alpha/Beta hydrolase protein [Aspergillus caelatus]|uniref:Alpha/Beta hydrolase protein n=1 Tax=Aspergillus caelatus TaxID=61420 RepID=A0A5N7A821_9EURO|nr:Alpha/Beta hydrolase protein [Aspergillus caelatus]KAE8364680.1 Alpha/Beta hydrolase protein [Aspergillus caelatus]